MRPALAGRDRIVETTQVSRNPEPPTLTRPGEMISDAVPADDAGADAAALRASEGGGSRPAVLARGTIGAQVFWLALPMLGEQVGVFMVGFVDTFLAGAISKEATAAVGAGGYMGWFVQMAVMMIGTGAAAIVARAIGAADLRTANRTLNQSLMLAVAIGLLITAVVLATATGLALLLTQTDAARSLFTTFVRIDAIGYTAMCVQLVLGGVLRAAGDTRTPMALMLVVNVVNALVSAAMVFGWSGLPEMGVRGVAIGTVVARWLGASLLLYVLWRGLRGLRFDRSVWRPDLRLHARILRVGLPAAGDAGLMWLGQMGFILIVAHSAFGDAATINFAAHTIAMRLEAISYLPAVAWMTAAATLVGQYLGARRPEQAARAGHLAALQAAGLTSLVGLCFILLPRPIYQLMTNDPGVVEVGAAAFRWLGIVQPVLGMAIVYIGALRGAGDTRVTMAFSLIGSLGLRIPIAYLFGIVLGGGLLGCWLGMWADNIAKFALGLGRFAQGGWKRARV